MALAILLDDAEPIVPDSLLSGIMPFTCAAGGMQH